MLIIQLDLVTPVLLLMVLLTIPYSATADALILPVWIWRII